MNDNATSGSHLTENFIEARVTELRSKEGTPNWRMYLDYFEEAIQKGKTTYGAHGFTSQTHFLLTVCECADKFRYLFEHTLSVEAEIYKKLVGITGFKSNNVTNINEYKKIA